MERNPFCLALLGLAISLACFAAVFLYMRHPSTCTTMKVAYTDDRGRQVEKTTRQC